MTGSTGKRDSEDAGRSENLADSPMMAHLMQALKHGEDIGHYGRLTFVMVARYFMSDDEMVDLLASSRDFEENDARALVIEVKGHGYNPPKRDRILQWQSEQEFPICPTPDVPNSCNVYRELRFPDEVYDNIGEFWEEQAQSA
jgi:DNA primase large subunit